MAREPDGPRFSSPEERHRAERRHRRRTLAVEVVVALAAGALVVALFRTVSDDDPGDEARDEGRDHTSITSCTVDGEGFGVAELTITNGSEEFSNYIVEVDFAADGGSERRNVNVTGVRAGETVHEEVRTREPVGSAVECDVESAFRLFAGAAPPAG